MRGSAGVRVIDLSRAPGAGEAWSRSRLVMASWMLAEFLFVSSPLQVSSRIRTFVLRRFGATIGSGVIIRPRFRVKFPWNLSIGDRSWIGEGVWIHNQNAVIIGSDVAISQEAFITTGSHRHRVDMGLITRPVNIEDGVWITSRCIVLGGAHVGTSTVATPMTVLQGTIPANKIVTGLDCRVVGDRFDV